VRKGGSVILPAGTAYALEGARNDCYSSFLNKLSRNHEELTKRTGESEQRTEGRNISLALHSSSLFKEFESQDESMLTML